MFGKLTQKKVLDALTTVIHPKTGRDIVASGAIDEVTFKDGVVQITMLIEPEALSIMEGVRKKCDEAVAKLSGVKSVKTVMTAHKAGPSVKSAPSQAQKPPAPPPPKPIPGIKRILAIASGKGGVGKSTTSINLATAFKELGWNVGIFDCDIYGPSVQRMLGEGGKADFTENDMIRPVQRHGIKAMSMGYLIPEGRATVWRGPMVIGAVQQLLNGVHWTEDGDLDILVVDLPPGTGDAQLTLVQTVPLTGVVIVSTPQDIALIDARKAYDMFKTTNIPVLGMVENMSTFICPHCHESTDIFGHGGARDTAKEKGIPFLGEVPLHLDIRTHADQGDPIVLSEPDSDHAKIYMDIARRLKETMPDPAGQDGN